MSIGAETGPPEDDPNGLEHARALYWRALVQLKVDCEYARRYRDQVAREQTWIAVGRAVVSVGALGS